jgi:hypothetical protein
MPPTVSSDKPGTADAVGQVLLGFNTMVTPIRDWLAGQRTYFTGQGYSDDEARAMAAALFVSMFGTGITRTPKDPE